MKIYIYKALKLKLISLLSYSPWSDRRNAANERFISFNSSAVFNTWEAHNTVFIMKLHAFTLLVETYRCIDVSSSFIYAHHGFFWGVAARWLYVNAYYYKSHRYVDAILIRLMCWVLLLKRSYIPPTTLLFFYCKNVARQ